MYMRSVNWNWQHLSTPKTSGTFYFTCTSCGSTKYVFLKYFLKYIPITTSDQIIYKAPSVSSCTHVWKTGVSISSLTPVPDGDVVLIRKNGKYGAFILRNQEIEPEQAEYEWWVQSDGSGNLDKSSKAVSTGRGISTGYNIKFLDFDIDWSGNSKGRGWLYYKYKPGEKVSKNDLHFCITKLKSLKGVDAADPKWNYKASPK